MTSRAAVWAALLCAVLALASAALQLALLARGQRLRRRMRRMRGEPEEPTAVLAGNPLMALVAGLGGAIARSGLLPARTLGELERSLANSGPRGGNGLALFVGAKLLLLLGLPLLTLLLLRAMPLGAELDRLLPIAAGVLGLLAPDRIVSRNRNRHRARLELGVPDTLDMLVICTQSGLALAPAMDRVATEIAHAHPGIARELEQTVRDLRIEVDSATALTALGERTGLDSLRRVTSALVQTIQYGTPVTDALRALAAELRQEALTRYEEKAARLPVMLTIPMIVFVLPCVFIVVGGPAVLEIGKAFEH